MQMYIRDLETEPILCPKPTSFQRLASYMIAVLVILSADEDVSYKKC